MIRWFCALVLALLPLPAFAQQPPPSDPKIKCAEWDFQTEKPAKKPPPVTLNATVAGPQGPERVERRQAAFKCNDGSKGLYFGWGMRNAAGKVIVPYRFQTVLPTSPTGAVVRSEETGLGTWTDGKGFSPLSLQTERFRSLGDFAQCSDAGEAVVILWGYYGQEGGFKLAIFHGSEKPTILEDADPPRRVNRLMIVPVTVPGGNGSQITDLFGSPRSGTIGKVSYWHAAKPQYGDTCPLGFPDMLSEGPSLDRNPAQKDIGPIYFPIGLDGGFYPMPEGALGIFPLRGRIDQVDSTYTRDDEKEFFSDSWALVYPDGQGWSFSIHLGKPLDAVSGATGTEPRYRNPVRDPQSGMFAAQDVRDGSWQVFYPGTTTPTQIAGTFADGRSALNGALSQIAANKAAVEASIRAAQQASLAAEREQYLQFRASKAGSLCQYLPPMRLTIEEISYHAERCPGTFTAQDLAKARQMGLSDDLENAVYNAWRESAAADYRAQLAREEAMSNPLPRPYVPGAWGDAIRAAGERVVEDINRQSENWFDARRKAYREEWQRKQRAY